MTRTTFSIVIPTRNRTKLLRSTLQQLCKQQYPTRLFEVIVIDNAPDDQQTELLVLRTARISPFPLRYVQICQAGSSPARNEGLRHSKYKHVIFLDDDLKFHPDLLQAYHEAWTKYPDARAIGGQVSIIREDEKPFTPEQQRVVHSSDAWCLGATVCPPHDVVLEEGGALVSANMSYQKKTKNEKLFNESLGRAFSAELQLGSEDYELSLRLLLAQEKLVYILDFRMSVWNRVKKERFEPAYLNTRYWLQGMELRLVEESLLQQYPTSLPIYRGTLWWQLTHWPHMFTVFRRFLTNKREWIRLLSYVWNGSYIIAQRKTAV